MTRSSVQTSTRFREMFGLLHTKWSIVITNPERPSLDMGFGLSQEFYTLSWDDLFFDLADMMVESPTVIQQ